VNTGWTGGPHGVGSRMKLTHTRRMLSEAIAGNLNEAAFQQDPVFGLWIPDRVDGVPSELLFPRNTWADKDAYDAKAKDLARMFRENFKKFEYGTSKEIIQAGPAPNPCPSPLFPNIGHRLPAPCGRKSSTRSSRRSWEHPKAARRHHRIPQEPPGWNFRGWICPTRCGSSCR
jgi:Phosphoenolpyruvate carboxykinase (ATP)